MILLPYSFSTLVWIKGVLLQFVFLSTFTFYLLFVPFRPTGGRSTWTNTACDSFSYYLTGASAVMTIKVFLSFPPVIAQFLSTLIFACFFWVGGFVCLFVCFSAFQSVSLYYFLIFKELTDERPVPVTLFCSNRMGEFISIADFLVSEGLALRQRKPRCVSACSTCIVGSGVLVCTGLFSFSK